MRPHARTGVGTIFFFGQGIVVGFLIAAPVGPVGLLCIRRALADGRGAAFVAGLGAAVADTFYGAVAGLGLTLVSDFLMEWRTPLSLLGAVVLLALGVQAWRTPIRLSPTPQGHFGLFNDFVTTLGITLTNPATIIAFMAVFASVGMVKTHDDLTESGWLIAGVFLGSALWWLTLSALAGAVRHKFSPRWLDALGKGSAALLIVSGLGVAGTVLWRVALQGAT